MYMNYRFFNGNVSSLLFSLGGVGCVKNHMYGFFVDKSVQYICFLFVSINGTKVLSWRRRFVVIVDIIENCSQMQS